jgi:hypothetical protein
MPPAATFLSATLPAAIVETILTHLAGLFLTGAAGDMTAARQAAAQMLAAYHPENEAELSLAAQIVSTSFHALDALGQAAAPDLPLTRVLRLRGGAVSLSRESHKAERRLDQLQKARQKELHPEPAQPEPKIEAALDATRDTSKTTVAAKANGPTRAQIHDQPQQDARIAASLKRAEARVAAHAEIAAAATLPGHHAPAIAPAF